MKMKLVPLLVMFLMLISLTQPIFAKPQFGDTRIVEDYDGQPPQDKTVNSGDVIKFMAALVEYVHDYFYEKSRSWEPKQLRYLEFYVYRSNADGTNGDMVYADVTQTGLFQPWAYPRNCVIVQRGTYNYVVKHDGGLNHCSATAKIYVV